MVPLTLAILRRILNGKVEKKRGIRKPITLKMFFYTFIVYLVTYLSILLIF